MEGDALAFERLSVGNFEPSIRNQLLDELRVVHDLIGPAEFRVLVFEGVEAMGGSPSQSV